MIFPARLEAFAKPVRAFHFEHGPGVLVQGRRAALSTTSEPAPPQHCGRGQARRAARGTVIHPVLHEVRLAFGRSDDSACFRLFLKVDLTPAAHSPGRRGLFAR